MILWLLILCWKYYHSLTYTWKINSYNMYFFCLEYFAPYTKVSCMFAQHMLESSSLSVHWLSKLRSISMLNCSPRDGQSIILYFPSSLILGTFIKKSAPLCSLELPGEHEKNCSLATTKKMNSEGCFFLWTVLPWEHRNQKLFSFS